MKKVFSVFLCLLSLVGFSQTITDTTTLRTTINTQIVPNGQRQISANQLNRILNGLLNTLTPYGVDSLSYDSTTNQLKYYRYSGFPTTTIQLKRVYNGGGSSGTVTNIGSGLWLLGGPITTSGTLLVDSSSMAAYFVRRKDSTITFTTPTQLATKIGLTNLSATSPIFYNNTTGVISSQAGSASQNGYITTTDFQNFAGKQNAITWQNVTAGSSKITLSGTPTGSVFNPFSIDVNEANLTISNMGGTLGINHGGTGSTVGVVDTIYRTIGKDSIQFTIGGRYHSILDSAGGGGTNLNVGSGYRWVLPNTNNVKTAFGINGILFDSTTNTNALTIQLDSTLYATRLRVQKPIDSLGTIIGTKQPQLNGTGFVKATGTTISYDNSTYLTANQTITFTPGAGDVTGSSSGTTSLTPTLTIGSNKVTYAKIQAASGAALLGTSSAGNFGEITLGTGLSFSGSVLNASAGGATNSNVGTGYRLAIPNTNNIKTLFGSLILFDSTTNTNGITATADTSSGSQKLATQGFVGRQGYLTNITGLVTSGTNITVSGSGTSGTPYVISSNTADSIQVITSGSAVTLNNLVNIVYIDPSVNLSSLTITMPATLHASKEITFYFGGTITSGSVVTSLSVVGNTGQTVLQASAPSTVSAGDFAISYKFRTSNSVWYRKN